MNRNRFVKLSVERLEERDCPSITQVTPTIFLPSGHDAFIGLDSSNETYDAVIVDSNWNLIRETPLCNVPPVGGSYANFQPCGMSYNSQSGFYAWFQLGTEIIAQTDAVGDEWQNPSQQFLVINLASIGWDSPTPILPWANTGGPTTTAGFFTMTNGDVGVVTTLQNGSLNFVDLGIPNAASFQAIQIGGSAVLSDMEYTPATNPIRMTWNTGPNPHMITAYELDVWFADANGMEELSSYDGGQSWTPYTPPSQQSAQVAQTTQMNQSTQTAQTVAPQQVTPQTQLTTAQPSAVAASPLLTDFSAGLILSAMSSKNTLS